jgi:hypothetical protein
VAARSGLSADRTIRPARANDIDGLTRAHLAAFRAGNGPALAPDVLARVTSERMRERWKAHLDDPRPARSCSSPRAAARSSEPPRPVRCATRTAVVQRPASCTRSTSIRGPGARATAGRCSAAALAHLVASGFEQAVLWVLEDNARARGFYAARGWTDGGERREWEGATILRLAREL